MEIAQIRLKWPKLTVTRARHPLLGQQTQLRRLVGVYKCTRMYVCASVSVRKAFVRVAVVGF